MNFKKLLSFHKFRRKPIPEEVEHSFIEDFQDITVRDDGLKIDWQRIVGFGNFSVVYIGLLRNVGHPVAVKVPRRKEVQSDNDINKDVLGEIRIMQAIGSHENVINLLGIHENSDIFQSALCVITPLCMNGSLQSYLRSKPVDVQVISEEGDLARLHHDSDDSPKSFVTLYELLKFASQIAHGMRFISSKNIIHGDLSCRNVLLDSNMDCQISDFGMSKVISSQEQGRNSATCDLTCSSSSSSSRVFPWRWMAIECLEGEEDISLKSDVWAFGVTLWEIFTIGDVPFPRLSWDSKFVEGLRNGSLRLHKPRHCNDEIFSFMKSCWDCDPTARPCFDNLDSFFRDVINSTKEKSKSLISSTLPPQPPLLHSLVSQADFEHSDDKRDSLSRASRRHSLIRENAGDTLNTITVSSAHFTFARALGKPAGIGDVVIYKEKVDGAYVAVTRFSDPYPRHLNAIKVMHHVGTHQNVVKFIGTFFTKTTVAGKEILGLNIINEFCESGSLHDYLHNTCAEFSTLKEHFDDPKYQTLLRFAFQVARGMEFISSRKIIHGDLSTLMVLLDANLTCKIRLSFLARKTYDHYDNVYTKRTSEAMQWRVLAVETLKRLEMTSKSDVWSYGVLIWEIFTLGEIPYKDWQDSYNLMQFHEQLASGRRLPKPEYANKDIYYIMKRCWENNPECRPSFTVLADFFERLMIGIEYTECVPK